MNRVPADSDVLNSTLKEEAQLSRNVKVAARDLGPEHTDVALSLMDLGDFYFREERFVDSAESFRRALDIYEALGEGHQMLAAMAMRSLSAVLMLQGKYAEGQVMNRNARILIQSYQ